jgi:hypothetical protein
VEGAAVRPAALSNLSWEAIPDDPPNTAFAISPTDGSQALLRGRARGPPRSSPEFLYFN